MPEMNFKGNDTTGGQTEMEFEIQKRPCDCWMVEMGAFTCYCPQKTPEEAHI